MSAARTSIAAALLAMTLGACAEMRRPPGGEVPPQGLVAPSPDPVGTALAAATDAFANQGAALAGRPAAAARAIAQFEFVAEAAPERAPLSAASRFAVIAARAELRNAIGVAPAASPPAVVQALARVAVALERGDAAAAEAALPAAVAPGGGAATLRRLGDTGALPNAEQATVLLTREASGRGEEARFGSARDTGATLSGDVLTEGLGRGF